MTGLLNLFLVLAPWVALVGGLVLLVLGVLHGTRVRFLLDISADATRPALATALLGTSLAGLGATYLLTDGATGYNAVYLSWLGVAALSGALGLTSSKQ